MRDDAQSFTRKRIAAEQIAALFGSVNVSVVGGLAAACVLTAALRPFGAADPVTSAAWAFDIADCTASHVSLRMAYRRSRTAEDRWRFWGRWFTAISFAEGVGPQSG